MSIDRSDIEVVADLARLELTDAEAEALTRDCRSILDHFEAIRELDVPDVLPGRARGRATPLRDDDPDPDPLEGPPSGLAPDWRDGFFVVPALPALDGTAGPEQDSE